MKSLHLFLSNELYYTLWRQKLVNIEILKVDTEKKKIFSKILKRIQSQRANKKNVNTYALCTQTKFFNSK